MGPINSDHTTKDHSGSKSSSNSSSTKSSKSNATSSKSSVPTIVISQSDYIAKQSGLDSSLDRLLKQRWKKALENGAMKYDIIQQPLPSRLIASCRYNFIASLNEGRGPGQRRTPQEMMALRIPFDPSRFNFTKINPNEILFRLKSNDSLVHTVIVNKSPIGYCSSLLVPSLEQCLPQVLTEDSLRLAIQFLCLSDQQSLRLGFNSAGAMASVNHQHWHIYYFEYKLTVEDLPVKNHLLQNWPIPAIVFELPELNDIAINSVVTKAMKIINFCLDSGQISHNLFLTRTGTGTIRLFIWLVEPRFGKKDEYINVAFCEFTGFIICSTKEIFSTLDEEDCLKLLLSIHSHHEDVLHLL